MDTITQTMKFRQDDEIFGTIVYIIEKHIFHRIYLTTKNGLNISFKPFHILNLIPLHIQPWQVHSFRCHTELP